MVLVRVYLLFNYVCLILKVQSSKYRMMNTIYMIIHDNQ